MAGLAFLAAALLCLWLFHRPGRIVRYQEPAFLTFAELRQLAADPHPGPVLAWKLSRFWRTPLISNEAFYRKARASRRVSSKLGPFVTVASWNIEKSYHIREAISAFTSAPEFEAMIDPARAGPGSALRQKALRQRERLAGADILVLQEMDIGVKRSGYINAAAELARALNMNYAYGTEQLEIDPVMLGMENIRYDDGSVDKEATEYYAADPARYKGAFGCAVLSRYPVKHAEVFQLAHQAYDWYAGEKPKIGFVEKARRAGSRALFKNELTREMKVGGRMYFRVDLDVPELPEKTLTIINIHLEIKCQPEGRERQMAEILSYIRDIPHPVIVMGDFNSAPEDLSPTSAWRVVERTAENPSTWLSVATTALMPHALAINATRLTSNVTKNLQNPLAPDIPVVAPNPVKKLFAMIENFRFADDQVFDFRGSSERSINGKDETLANSNERDLKGFKTTFSVKRPLAVVVGKYRLDWAFVKAPLRYPQDEKGLYRFAPHFGETLEEMNTVLTVPISDHHPNVLDLPFNEPPMRNESPAAPVPASNSRP